MIRYVITLFLLIQTNILPLSIDITIDGHSQNDNIVNLLQKDADYEKDIKPYITTHKLVTDEDIINSEKINMKYILKQ